jgi:hypothetical protein
MTTPTINDALREIGQLPAWYAIIPLVLPLIAQLTIWCGATIFWYGTALLQWLAGAAMKLGRRA